MPGRGDVAHQRTGTLGDVRPLPGACTSFFHVQDTATWYAQYHRGQLCPVPGGHRIVEFRRDPDTNYPLHGAAVLVAYALKARGDRRRVQRRFDGREYVGSSFAVLLGGSRGDSGTRSDRRGHGLLLCELVAHRGHRGFDALGIDQPLVARYPPLGSTLLPW